jgi:hypothetical protein
VDRLGGGVAIYVKNDYHVVHRNDLEVLGVECVWVEFKISKNHPVLIGTFYRPPDSLNYTFDLIEHSIDLAVDTGINTIVVLGDFNEDQLKPQNNKMSNIFVKYNMIQFINEPTHFTGIQPRHILLQGPLSHFDGPHDNRFSHKLLHLPLAYLHGLF